MLEILFGSKTRIKVLKCLIFQTHPLPQRTIAKNIDVNINAVKRELENLKKINLIRQEKIGNVILSNINKKCVFYEEIKKIILKSEGLNILIKEGLKKANIKLALIFGSFAKGKETENSDIDMLIVGNVKEDEIINKIRKAERETGREVNYILWTEKEFERRKKEKDTFLNTILREPKIMVIGDLNED